MREKLDHLRTGLVIDASENIEATDIHVFIFFSFT